MCIKGFLNQIVYRGSVSFDCFSEEELVQLVKATKCDAFITCSFEDNA